VRFQLVTFIALLLLSHGYLQEPQWTYVAKSLELARFKAELHRIVGDSTITILRIDPSLWDFKLWCAPETGDNNLTARQWCEKYHLVVAVNAGMFQTVM
jgi:hypothetical protein